jgi:amino acid adenylation domain-containing protein
MQADLARPIDLERGPLLRGALLRVADDEHLAVFCFSHLCLDMLGMELVFERLEQTYTALAEGRPAPEFGAGFAAFLADDAAYAASERKRDDRRFWLDHCRGLPPAPSLSPRASSVTGRGRARYARAALGAPVLERLSALAQAEGLRRSQVVHALVHLYVSRLTGQEDVTIGLPRGNRAAVSARTTPADCVNFILPRVRFPRDGTLRELLRAVGATLRDCAAHERYPLAELVRELGIAPAPRLALFSVLCNHLPLSTRVRFAGFEVEAEMAAQPVGPCWDLSVMFRDDEAGRRGELIVVHPENLYTAAEADRHRDRLIHLLESAPDHLDAPLHRIPMMPPPERQRVLVEWNDTASGADIERTVHGLVAAQARRTPDRVALECGDERLGYATLTARAAALAGELVALGVGRDRRVGVCLERSTDLVVSLLAILEAGGAYVPLDPAYPAGRLADMVEDSGIRVLVTSPELAGRFPGFDGVVVDPRAPRRAAAGPAGGATRVTADDLAYVIYTSGSTGRPKGVAVPHRGVVNVLLAMARRPGLSADDALLAVTTISFDIHALELFLPLTVGARVVLASREEASDGRALAALLQRSRATVLQATPSTWRLLLDAGWRDRGLKLICGGEALTRPLAERLLAAGGELWNVYGPTETTIWATTEQVEPGSGAVPIGRPIDNLRAYVVDARGEPVPIGVAGELWLGGPQVVRGYLERPELTAERFLPDPFASEPGARLYRTGDLVRFDERGRLEFLGRLDDQVKLRGHRIELGEIETALSELPDIAEAAVSVVPVGGEPALAACLVSRSGSPTAPETIRAALAARLPEVMIPGAYAFLPELPRTPAGKLDRARLAGLQPEFARHQAAFEAPRDPVEQELAARFQELLGVARVSVHDDFFRLGGHSLLGTRLLAAIRERLGAELTLGELFAAPTVAALGARVAGQLRRGLGDGAPPLRASPRAASTPASRAQQRLWLLDRLGTGAAYNIPLVLRGTGRLDEPALQRALAALAARHEALRTRFVERDGALLQCVETAVEIPLRRLERAGLDGAARERAVAEAAARTTEAPFDLSRAPLFRVTRLSFDDQDHALILVVHHSVADGTSLGLLASDLAALYAACAQGQDAGLPPLAVQPADFAAWQRERLDERRVGGLLESWRRELGADLPVLELLTDRPRPATQRFGGAGQAFELDATLTAAFAAVGRERGATLAMTCLAAWTVLLARYTGQDRIVVGSPSAGRRQPELEGVVGFFVNTLVLPVDVTGDPTFAELLARVRRVSLAALDHEELPFETLVAALDPARDASRAPLFQVAFAMQEEWPRPTGLPGLELEAVPIEPTLARFDLELHLQHAGAGLRGLLIYNTDLFEAATIARLTGHFKTLLAGAAAAPETPLSALPVLAGDERRRVLVEWNETATAYPRDRSVPELFDEVAAASPDAVAVRYGTRRLSYRELAERSGRLARALRAAGIGRGACVGVRLRRDVEFVVALLAVLKAGGVYVPLDPEHPCRRSDWILRDAGATVLLTQRSLLSDLPAEGRVVISVDDERPGTAEGAAEGAAPLPCPGPTDPAYVIYTSGSTGQPKGVCVPHRAIVRLVRDTDYVALGPDDRLGQVSVISFDAATFEIWGALLNGGSVVGVPKEVALDADRMAEHLRREGISAMFATAALFNQLVSRRPDVFATLRYVLVGGEAVDPRWMRTALEHGAPRHLLNGYGPTESTTFAVCGEVREVPAGARNVPLGRPIANTRAYVLDAHGQPVPVGVAGELYLGGDGLADGYLNAPELTRARFVERALDGLPSQRLYRTGDRVRWLEDGRIEFLNRLDSQVKLRGHRIEPGEIEAALLATPDVAAAAVVVREDVPGDKRLVAYVVGAAGRRPAPEALRRALRESLPAFMLPSAFVPLDALPLNANGKLDRAALPVPHERPAERAAVAPRTPTEQRLAAIWRELLRLEAVGVHDDFFELGGHSLLGMQMISRVRDQFGLGLPFQSLFEEPTVGGLAGRLDELLAVHAGSAAQPAEDGQELDL